MRRSVQKKSMRMLSVSKRATARQQMAAAKRAAHIGSYREVTELANLAVRGLQLGPGELKAKDQSIGSFAVDFNGAVYLLNGVARGDDIDERVGRQILIKAFEINAIFKPAAAGAAPVPSTMRMMIVYDKQTNGAALTPAQVLLAVGSANAPVMPKNLEYRDRFSILRDMKFGLASAELTDYQPAPKVVKVYQSIVLPTTFNAGDAGTVADITTGSLYALFISDQAAAPLPTCQFTSRVRYEDK